MLAARWFARAALVVVSIATLSHRLDAQRTDVIRGRVVGPDSSAIQNATITAVDTVAKVPKQVRTDATGAYSVSFDNGSGSYLVAVNMLGYAAQRRVVTRPATGPIPPVNFKLSQVAAQLGAVNSVGERPKAARSDFTGDAGVGGIATYTDMSSGRSGDVTGDISAALATLPGISLTPSGTGGLGTISAFGLGSDQNGSIMNGLGFGAQVPRDGFNLSVVTSTYDPSKGGFAGVLTSLRMQSGGNTSSRSIHGTVDSPSLQFTSPVASRLGTEYNQQVVSGALSGPIKVDRAFYAGSYQLSRRASNLTTLSSADAASLEALNLSPDTVSRLLLALQPFGIPVRTAGVPSSRQNTEGRLALRFDLNPNIPETAPGQFGANTVTFDDYNLQIGGTLRSNGGLIGQTSVPSSGTEASHHDAWAMFTAAKYLPKNILNEATISVSGAQDRSDPYLDLPSARILLSSPLANGSTGLSSAVVGGSNSPHSNSRTWSGELRNQTTWNTWDRRHSFALTLDATEDGYGIQQDAGFGGFAFNSLADFANGVPASYSRTLTGRHTSGTGFTGAVAIGDVYNPQPPGSSPPGVLPPIRPRLQYGLRLEGNHFGVRPSYNSAVDSVFHRRTDFVPGGVHVMPMVGFAMQIFPEFKGDNGLNFGRRGNLSGGIREYRGALSTRTIDGYARQTGLPDAIQTLYCVGAASPIPNWKSYEQQVSTIPDECANGSAPTPLAQTTPNVALFSPDYQFSESWRPTLQLNYVISTRFRATIGGSYSLNRHIGGQTDLNFNRATKFSLASEAGRPVYVSPTSIVPTTGTSAWTESRVSPLFAHVTESRNDLNGRTTTLNGSLSYSPFSIGPTSMYWNVTLGYAFNDAREQYRGIGNGNTAGDPTVVAWSRGGIGRHVVTLNGTLTMPSWGYATLTARAQSGTYFTPGVLGDINGDGYNNDRPFIFNPATADTSVARVMSQLLSNGPANIRDCLKRQLGAIAGRNSCVNQWSVPTFNLSISPDAYRTHLGNRGSVTLLVTNVLGGLDQALHGSDKLHGWGQQAFADQTLLTVRGFNSTTNSYVYSVNPLFGNTKQFRSAFRAPFTLTVDFRFQVEPDRETQFLEALLRPRAAEHGALTEQQVKIRIARRFNPVDQIITFKDSLKLTDAQVDSMRSVARRFEGTRDSIVTDVARFLLSRNGDYGGEEVRTRWHSAGVASYSAYLREMRAAIAIFTPEQRERTKVVQGTQGILNIETIKDQDLPFMFRFSMSSLP